MRRGDLDRQHRYRFAGIPALQEIGEGFGDAKGTFEDETNVGNVI